MSVSLQRQTDFISASRFLMIGGLVYHHLFEIPGSSHSPRLNMAGSEHFLPDFINSFFHMAFMAAVPMLSVVSGFLFFNRSQVDFTKLLHKRLYTVALPSWIWAALWLLLAYVLFSLGYAQGLFAWADYGFDDAGPMTWLNGVFGVTRHPFAFQFWFVRDLLLVLLLSPLIYFALQLLGHWLVAIALVLWVLIPSPPVFFSGNVPVFFTIGAWMALTDRLALHDLLERLVTRRALLLVAVSTLLVIRIMSHQFGPLDPWIQGHAYLCLLRLTGVTAIAALIYGMVRGDQAMSLPLRYSGYSYFIFAAHFPLIELVQVAALRLPGHASEAGLLLSWLLLPLLTIAICIMCARSMELYLPRVFHLLNGGRRAHVAEGSLRAIPT